LNRAIAFARVRGEVPARLWVEIRGRMQPARVVKPPFVRNGKALIEL
jgi:aminomethyltransferase